MPRTKTTHSTTTRLTNSLPTPNPTHWKNFEQFGQPVASVNPLQFYNNTRTSVPDEDVDLSFELHTMKVPQQF